MIRPLKLAHTSDVHLYDGCTKERDSFMRVVDAVIETGADLFLIAGDLFDHNRVKADSIDFVYAQLARVACPTVIIAGNHDCFDQSSVLRGMDFAASGEHVHLLTEAEGRSIEFPELHATVWGRSMVDHDESNKPLAGSPGRSRDLWHIGMAHGLYVDYPGSGRSSLITPDEIAATGFDYLALGHVHVHGQMRHGNTLACYPGSPTPYDLDRHPSCVTIVDLLPGREAVAIQLELPVREAVSV
ncbi:MAG TPA: DNA repair exonuclease [Burkholderiales bacterium]|nr:DNA repair exonuclease [Burkholderiales bacterium]